eukprot:m.37427 g.37427  ORF g.37427 m.37427 type:complete len:849 (+) comp11105_c0_seq1:252-2798(+)
MALFGRGSGGVGWTAAGLLAATLLTVIGRAGYTYSVLPSRNDDAGARRSHTDDSGGGSRVRRLLRADARTAKQIHDMHVAVRQHDNGRTKCSFRVSEAPLAVAETPGNMAYANTPLSRHRVAGQFDISSGPPGSRVKHWNMRGNGRQDPLVSVVTAVQQGEERYLAGLASTLQTQSLKDIEWVVVASDTAAATRAATNSNAAGYSATASTHWFEARAKVVGLSRASRAAQRHEGARLARGTYTLLLLPSDRLELTALEKAVWMLEGHGNVTMAGFYSVHIGTRNRTWTFGFQDLNLNLQYNRIGSSFVVRTAALQALPGGGLEAVELASPLGLQDWCLAMALARAGHWGYTIPELLFWRTSSTDSPLRVGEAVDPKFVQGLAAIPNSSVAASPRLSSISTVLPFHNPLYSGCHRALFLVPWLALGGADLFNVDMVKVFAKRGWPVTVVSTLYQPPASTFVRPEMLKHTHDVFTMPNFLKLTDFPRFIAYLIESRGITHLVLSNSQLGYDLLPFVREVAPHVVIVDYVHSETVDWKSGGYVRYSLVFQNVIDKTFTTSKQLAQRFIEEGLSEDRVDVSYLGVDPQHLSKTEEEKEAVRRELGMGKDSVVVLVACRIAAEKQPLLIIEAFAQAVSASKNPDGSVLMVVAGDGPLLGRMKDTAADLMVDEHVEFLGGVSRDTVKRYMVAADVFFQPSLFEGISMSLFEAMSMSLAVVASAVGGQAEVITSDCRCGFLVTNTGYFDIDVAQYGKYLATLVQDSQVRAIVAGNARKVIETRFDSKRLSAELAEKMIAQTLGSRHRPVALDPDAATAVGRLYEASDQRKLSDIKDFETRRDPSRRAHQKRKQLH